MTFNQGHALLVGVNSYRFAPYLNVPIATTDIMAVAQVLTNPYYCGYPRDQVDIITNEEATRNGVLRSLDKLALRTKTKDTALIFFVGHGDYSIESTYYFFCHDTKIENNKIIGGTGIDQQELLEKIKRIPTERLVIIFNTCYSGKISPTLGVEEYFGSKILPGNTVDALLATGKGRVIITACREKQVSFIGKGKLSIFTQAFVDGLQGKRINSRGGFISIFDLYTAIFNQVSSNAWEMFGSKQEPALTVLNGVGPMVVAIYRGSENTNLDVLNKNLEIPLSDTIRLVESNQSIRSYEKIIREYCGINIGSDSPTYVDGDLTGKNHVDTSGGSYIIGNVNTGGGNFIGRDQHVIYEFSNDQVTRLFSDIYSVIKNNPKLSAMDKVDFKTDVEEILKEAVKGERANESLLAHHLRNIRRLDPGILEIVLATLTNPTSGVSKVIQKVTENASEANE